MIIKIYDLDGTLLDSSHRYRLDPTSETKKIDLAHWKNNEHLAHLDQPIKAMVDQFKRDMEDPEVITAISTNRYFCDKTRSLLSNIGIIPDFISARTSDDQKSAEIKEHAIRDLMVELSIFKGVFYDDNIRILRDVKNYLKDWITVIYKPSDQGF